MSHRGSAVYFALHQTAAGAMMGRRSRSRGTELVFDWRELTLLKDSDDAIEFHFRAALVLGHSPREALVAFAVSQRMPAAVLYVLMSLGIPLFFFAIASVL